ncbi:MAG: tetratricopeptide repeat protein [Acidobacteria bacterium]|nr:tetratricopeptide repeat protein [Acidobacteriota bacterium]
MSTNKMTRKEILSEDPVHEALLRLVGFFGENKARIGVAAAAVVLLAVGAYGVSRYLGAREARAQVQLGKGIDFFHAAVEADAGADPYAKGPNPVFPGERAKYEAAAREFSAIASGHGYGKIAVVARYYLGLSQLRLGQEAEGIKSLESAASDSRNRSAGFLAKRVLAHTYYDSGNYQGAQEILSQMIRDPKCDLPREELSLELARALEAQGRRDEAVKALREADEQSAAFGPYKQKLIAEIERLGKAPSSGPDPASQP